MYRGFKIEPFLTAKEIAYYQHIGESIFDDDEAKTKAAITKLIYTGKTLDGTEIQEAWFPLIKADLFISHSRQNEKEVKALAGMLWDKFKIKAFIDSSVWGSAFKLQKDLDDVYSWVDPKEKKDYQYKKVGESSSHVHMMLSTALAMMIDKCECLFFYKTPQSIDSFANIDKTASPWIYNEIAITQIVRKKIPLRLKPVDKTRYFSKGGIVNEDLRLKYKVSLNHLTNLSEVDFRRWEGSVTPATTTSLNSLDKLYNIIPPKGVTNLLLS